MAGKQKDEPEFKKGDRVIVQGLPYSSQSTKAIVMTSVYPSSGGREVIGIKYNYLGIKYDTVDTRRVIKVDSGINKPNISRKATITLIVLFVVFLMGIWFAGNYNSLVHSKNAVNLAHSKIDTQLERRYELIDNLVASVKGSQGQEQEVFGAIANARKQATNSGNSAGEAEANNTIDTQIALLPKLQEAYPELKSNDQVSKLIKDLEDISTDVRTSRDNYNDVVTNYNNGITSFPKNIFANIFNFKPADLFKADPAAQKNPKVDFGSYGNGTEDNSKK